MSARDALRALVQRLLGGVKKRGRAETGGPARGGIDSPANGCVMVLGDLDVLLLEPSGGALLNGSAVEIRGAAGFSPAGRLTIECLEGVLWVTQKRSEVLTILEAGDSLVAERTGEIEIQALGASRLCLAVLTQSRSCGRR